MSKRLSELEFAELLNSRGKKRGPRLPVYREKEAPPKVESRRKYGNKKTEYDGYVFDSIKEMNRYQELRLLEKVGAITDLKLQVPFVFEYNGVKICTLRVDFTYLEGKKRIVEDVKGGETKGTRTREYLIKKKLLRAFYLQEIRET